MSLVPPILFTFAAMAAALTIWKSAARALPAIRALRGELADASRERVIHVATLDMRKTPERPTQRRARARRHPQPKPITHRLHHFPHRASAA